MSKSMLHEEIRRAIMDHSVDAKFEDGVFKPDRPLDIPAGTRVQLIINYLDDWPTAPEEREQAAQELEQLWDEISIDSGGERLTRDQLHERR
jgi:predicted DNA-binding antitoxin AbrB/MazE fold protein